MAPEETSTATATEAPEPEKSEAKSTSKKTLEPDDVEYRFTGDPQIGVGPFPARDLTQADVDRVTYRRTIPEPGTQGLRRGESGFSEARAKVVRELTATGKFKKRS